MTLKKYLKSNQGFSLVELAIVMVIIGLITGSILKGKELIEAAKIRNLLQQISEIRTAVSSFSERYGALPGDFNGATERLHDSLKNGDNNQKIDGDGLDINSEAGQFWQHLYQSRLLPSLAEAKGDLDFGKGLPATKLGGGISIHYGDFNTHEHWLVIGNKDGVKGNSPLLTPEQAFSIDQKLDDSNGTTGTVRATGDGCLKGDGSYNLQEKKPLCTLYVML